VVAVQGSAPLSSGDEGVKTPVRLPCTRWTRGRLRPKNGYTHEMKRLIDRRTFVKTGALATGSLVSCSLSPTPVSLSGKPQGTGAPRFDHRGYLGWITDLATDADSHAAWPSMRLNEKLLNDYRQTFGLMKQIGFNEISVWGLYVSRAWPVDIRRAVSSDRGPLVQRLIDSAHENGIRVYSGLGIYSWGFEEIIRANPKLTRGNPQAMCASEPQSWAWMQKVVDFVFERFRIDGVSMQSADQGRCRCDQCRIFTDAEYHALLNVRVADYIRSRWPKKTVAVNSWGMKFEEPASLPSLVKISQKVDYLIDVHDTSRKLDPGYRRKVIQSLACAFGTLGGPQVEPPQHWRRDRWFLPTLKRVGTHLQALSAEGGRACEFFFHILANPGDELSFWLAGKTLSDPATAWQKHLEQSVESLYSVPKVSTRDALIRLFLDAEEAYFKHQPEGFCGTISMEPLVSDRPGPPIYVKPFALAQRTEYARELRRLKDEAQKLLPELREKTRIHRIARCLENALADVAASGRAQQT